MMFEELRDKQFNRVIDRYLDRGHMPAGEYENCTPLQKAVIQVLKRSFARKLRKYGDE